MKESNKNDKKVEEIDVNNYNWKVITIYQSRFELYASLLAIGVISLIMSIINNNNSCLWLSIGAILVSLIVTIENRITYHMHIHKHICGTVVTKDYLKEAADDAVKEIRQEKINPSSFEVDLKDLQNLLDKIENDRLKK